MRSCSSFEDVNITTGRSFVRSSARIRLSTSRPSIFGSLRSSRVTLGSLAMSRPANDPVPKRKSRASTPSRATTTSFWMLFFFSARSVNSSSSGLSSTSKITLSLISPPFSSLKREIKCRALIDFPFGPDFAAVAVHDALDRRQPNPRAVEFGHGVQALKGAEQLAGIGHVEPGAIVAHEVDRPAVVLADAEFDLGRRVFSGKLPGVAQQIFH